MSTKTPLPLTLSPQEPRYFPSGDSRLGHLTNPKPRTPTRRESGGGSGGGGGGAPAGGVTRGSVPSLFGRPAGAGSGSSGGGAPPGGFFG
jgi:hypothetical protein